MTFRPVDRLIPSTRPSVLRLIGVFLLLLGSTVIATTVADTPRARAATMTVSATTDQAWNPFSSNPSAVTVSGTTVADSKSIRVSFAGAGAFSISPSQFTIGPCPSGVSATVGASSAECYISGPMVSLTLPSLATISAGTAFSLVYAAGSISSSADVSSGTNRQIAVGTYNGDQWNNELIDSATASLSWPFTVTFDANGGTGTMQPQVSSTAQNLTTNVFTKTGLTFDGWSSFAGGSQAFADGASYPFSHSSSYRSGQTLYARWLATVTFDANGGTGTMLPQTDTGYKQLSANAFTRSGYTFQGWNTDSQAAWASYPGGSYYTFDASTTLYAVWQEDQPSSPPPTPEVDLTAVNGIGNTFRPGTVGTPLDPPLVVRTSGMTGPVTFTAVTQPSQGVFVPAQLPAGLSFVTTSATAAEIVGTPTSAGVTMFYIQATDASDTAYSTTSVIIDIAQGSSGGTTGGTTGGTPPPPPPSGGTTSPTEPAGVEAIESPAPGTQPSLVSTDDAPALQQQAGQGGATVNGVPTEVEVVTVDEQAADVPAEQRTPEQVAALQESGRELVDAFNSAAPGGTGPLVTITDTDTGAVVNGVAVDPTDGETDVPVPVEDVVLLSTTETKVLFAAVTDDGEPEEVTGGVLELSSNGGVSVLAYGLPEGQSGELVLFSTPTLLATFTAGADGSLAAQMRVPAGLGAGAHTLVLAAGGVTASLGLLVDADGNAEIIDPGGAGTDPSTTPTGPTTPAVPGAPSGRLPNTGDSNTALVLMLGVWSMLIGVVLVSRRRVVLD